MFPILNLGPLAIATPGLILLAGLWLGLLIAEKQARRYELDPNHLYNVIFACLLFGIMGARLAFVAQYPQAFSADWTDIFSLSPTLLEPSGAVLGVLAAWIYARKRKLVIWGLLDAMTPVFAIVSFAIGLAHLAAGTAYGLPAQLPWSIELWGSYRHPTQVYWMLISSLVFWLTGTERLGIQPEKRGTRFIVFCALTATGVLFTGAFLVDLSPLPAGLHLIQIIAWFVQAVCLWGIGKRSIPRQSPDQAITINP